MTDHQRKSDAIILKLASDFKTHCDDEADTNAIHEQRYQQLLDAQSQMAEQQRQNTQAISELTAATKDIVEISREIKSVASLGARVQAFLIWVSKMGVAGAMLYGGIHWVLQHVGKH